MYDRVLQYCQVAEVVACLYNIARWLKCGQCLYMSGGIEGVRRPNTIGQVAEEQCTSPATYYQVYQCTMSLQYCQAVTAQCLYNYWPVVSCTTH
jgi:hypothetical protein